LWNRSNSHLSLHLNKKLPVVAILYGQLLLEI
jgi:hypothetical protein